MKFQRPLATVVVSLTICLSIIAQNTTFQGRVIDVIDGTTVVVETQSKTQFHVRCLGAVAPNGQQSSASESQQRLSSLVLGETVTVKASKRDESGNLLGTIRLNEHDICLEQVKSGLALLDEDQTGGLTSSARRVYATAESSARTRTIGVWTDNTASRQVSSTREVNEQPTSTSTSATRRATDSHALTTDNSTSSTVDVRSYFRTDGSFVPAHKRTGPDDRVDNNWSTLGNVNPYTGKPGNRSWLRRNWWIFPTVGALIGTGYLVNRYLNNTGGIVCRDGWLSPAQNRQGACSHHGGILQ